MRKILIIMLVTMIMTLSISSIVSASNWVYLGSNTDMKIHIDESRMKVFENSHNELIIEYWLAATISPQGKAKLIQLMKEENAYEPWIERLDYMVMHIKTNIETKKENKIRVYNYDINNKLLYEGQGDITDIKEGTNSAWWNTKVIEFFIKKLEEQQHIVEI